MRRRRQARRAGALLLLALATTFDGLTVARTGLAQALPQDVADVVIAGTDAEASAILAAVRAPLADLGLRVRASRAADLPGPADGPLDLGARARVWIDARPVDRVDVVVAVPSGDRPRSVARSVARGDSRSIVAEEVAYVVRATLESLLAEPAPAAALPPPSALAPPVAPSQLPSPSPSPVTPIAPPDVEPSPQAPLPDRPTGSAAHPNRRSAFGLDAAAFGTARAIGAAPAIGAGGALEAAPWGRVWRPALWLGGAYNAPFETRSPLVTLQTSLVSLRALADLELLRAGSLRVNAGAGGGIDVFHAVPLPAGSPFVTLGPTTTRVDPILAGRVLAAVHVEGGPSFLFAVDLDYDAQSHRYQASQAAGGPPTAVLDPWRVRPGGEVGLSIPLFGGGP